MTNLRGVLAPGRRAAYALAGDAVFTILNQQTGTRFTYKVTQTPCHCVIDDMPHADCQICRGTGLTPQKYFVKVLTGPENSSDYTYAGMLDHGAYRATAKSKIGVDAPSVFSFIWLSKHWEDPRIEVWHEGVCGHCGRRLTVPESIESGIGPVCAARGAA